MTGAILAAEERGYELRMMRRQINSAVHRRMNMMLLLDDAWPVRRIAAALFIDAETVREHRRLHAAGGIEGLEKLGCQIPEAAPDNEQLDMREAELARNIHVTAKPVCQFVTQAFEVSYTPNAMTRLLKRLGDVYRKPKYVPAKADTAAQQRFHDETLLPLMRRAGPDAPLYVVGGMQPSYTGHPAYGWIKKGTDRELCSKHGRVNVNINGALSLPERAVMHLEAEKLTPEAMIALFERLWLFLEKTPLWNEYDPTFTAFRAANSGIFDNLETCQEQLASLIIDQFRFTGVSKPRIPAA